MKIRSPQDSSGNALSALTDVVAETLYDANTVLIATVDNTPAALTVEASTLVGRGAAGGIDDLSPASARTVLELDSASVGKGASLIAIQDAGAYYTTDNVEAALAQIGLRESLMKRGTATITAGNTSVDVALGAATWNGKPAQITQKTATDATLLYLRGYSFPDPSTLRIIGGPANATGSVAYVYEIDGS